MKNTIEKLSGDQFYKRLNQYFSNTASSLESREFESSIDKQLYEQLEGNWSNGWDFEIRDEFFGDRGVSILIQNRLLEWQPIWDWLTSKVSEMPYGAAINFEVFDNIHDEIMNTNQMILRRVILSNGTVEEDTEEAE